MLSWIFIIGFLILGWRLGQPELTALWKRWSRTRRWVGALQPTPAACKLYEDTSDLERLSSYVSLSSTLRDRIEESNLIAGKHLKYPVPRVDSRLCLIAQWAAEAIIRGQQISQSSTLRYLCSHFGTSAPLPIIIHQRQNNLEGRESFLGRYHEQLIRAMSLGAPELAVGLAEHVEGDERINIAVFQPRHLLVNPFARKVVGDMGIVINGETLEMMPLEAWITTPDGKVQQVELTRNGSHFSLQIKNRDKGIYQIELLAERTNGPVVCLNIPLYRSVKPPSELILTEEQLPSRWGWVNRRRLHALINESRKLVGAHRLPMSKTLNQIAQEYASQMADEDFVSHTSPIGERLDHRSSILQQRAERVLENLSVGATVGEVHDQLMASPAHRAAILDNEVTHVGLGISASGGQLFSVQVFSLMNRRLRLTEDRAELYRVIQRQRREDGLVRLPHDTTLEVIALEIARALVNGTCKPQEVNQHAQHLITKTRSASTLNDHNQRSMEDLSGFLEVFICQLNRVELLPKNDLWLQDQVKSFGVGLAQGASHEPYWVVSVMRLQDQTKRNLVTSIASKT